jgi:DNA-binding GntR family transcriptional regulator
MARKKSSGSWRPKVAETASDRVYEAVRDRILGGRYARGEFIREHEVAEGMGTSHTPVREAFGRLASEGLLERIPHRGYRLPEQSTTDFLELVPILSWVELLAVRLSLPHLTPEDVGRLRQLNQQIMEAIVRDDALEIVRVNARFHRALASKCGNERLLELLDRLEGETLRVEFLDYARRWHRDRLIENHRQMIAALEERRFADVLTIVEGDRLAVLELPGEALAENR